jgi:hypothetical protein
MPIKIQDYNDRPHEITEIAIIRAINRYGKEQTRRAFVIAKKMMAYDPEGILMLLGEDGTFCLHDKEEDKTWAINDGHLKSPLDMLEKNLKKAGAWA